MSNTALLGSYGAQDSSSLMFRNRIINGDMRIDQRNAGVSVTPTAAGTYTLDRWVVGLSQTSKFSVAQSPVAPTGFANSILVTSLSAYSVGASETFFIQQYIEGFNTADLMFGTASAQTVSLSFWVRSSLTGTFGGSIGNASANYAYPFTYSVSAANTWEQKTISIPGAVAGTWVGSTNGRGMRVLFNLGSGANYSGTANTWQTAGVITNELYAPTGATSLVGTNSATLYITGVQLEAGAVATPFERRPIGTEIQLCQRYFEKSYNIDVAPGTSTSIGASIAVVGDSGSLNRLMPNTSCFAVPKRINATVSAYSETGTKDRVSVYSNSGSTLTVSSIPTAGNTRFGFIATTTNAVDRQMYYFHWTAEAEL